MPVGKLIGQNHKGIVGELLSILERVDYEPIRVQTLSINEHKMFCYNYNVYTKKRHIALKQKKLDNKS